MKVFCLVPNPHANGTGLNFKSNLRPAALARFTKRENFKNFVAHEQAARAKAINRAVGAVSSGFKACVKTADREAVFARRAGYTCRGAKTASVISIDAVVSKNISNLAPLKHCADRKNFKIFASDKIKFSTHGEPKPATHSMARFTARRRLKLEPCGTTARDFAMRDKILNSSSRKNCVRFKISPPRDAEKRQNEI
ncbi:hypothetical protein [uncultured Campylobacter sp.]|uniref:hypothetical protein n=1 Tax=uncultured Campylobacter sp. TaxID=218934 RepID=UPI00260464F9|nr:hypothetical protein [uncultured Campylobacter sp.]